MKTEAQDFSFPGPSRRIGKTIFYSGILFFIIHFIFSWLWFRERMLQEDGPFYMMKMMQQGKMLCEHYRYSALLIQWLPFIAMKSGASIEWIMRFYSVANEVFYFLLFTFCVFFLKNYKGALLMILFLCLASGRDYFLPASEYQPAIVTSLLIFGLPFSSSQKTNRRLLAGAFIVILVAVNFHPVSLFALGFIILFEFINAGNDHKKTWIKTGIFWVAVFTVRSLAVPFDNYENNKLNSWSLAGRYFFHPDKLRSVPAAIHYFYSLFPELIVLFGVSILLLLLRKKFASALATILFTYFLFILFGVIKGVDETNIWFGEYFILAGIPALLPVTRSLAGNESAKWILPCFLLMSISICVWRLEENAGYFRSKIEFAARLIENGKMFEEKKYIISTQNVPHLYIHNTWPITFQTLMLSSFNNPGDAVTFIALPDINACDTLISNPDNFLGPEWEIQMFNARDNKIRKKYFNLPSKGYRKLTTSQQLFSASDSIYNAASVTITPAGNIYCSSRDSIAVATLKITNTSGHIIPAIPDNVNPTLLSYHIWDINGKLLSWDNLRTSLEADIYKTIVTGLNISVVGLKKGTYVIESDFVTENERWWGIKSRFNLVVH